MTLSSQIVGRMGELLAEISLLRNGWLVANVNNSMKNAVAYDLMARKGERQISLRVKTFNKKTSAGAQYSAKEDGTILKNLAKKDDFVLFVALDEKNFEGTDFYMVPANIVQENVQADHKAWISGKKRDGEDRKLTGHPIACF